MATKSVNTTSSSGGSSSDWWQPVVVFLVAFLVYANTLQHSYAWDDALVITNNVYTQRGIEALTDVWTKQLYLDGRDVYRPLTQTIFLIEQTFFGNSPHLSHAVNVFLFSVCALLLFRLVVLLFPAQQWLALLAAILFAVHPVHAEAVANIKSRDEVLALLFSLVCLIMARRFSDTHQLKHFVFSGLALLAGSLSKLNAITVLPVALLIATSGSWAAVFSFARNCLKSPALIIVVMIAVLFAVYLRLDSTRQLLGLFVVLNTLCVFFVLQESRWVWVIVFSGLGLCAMHGCEEALLPMLIVLPILWFTKDKFHQAAFLLAGCIFGVIALPNLLVLYWLTFWGVYVLYFNRKNARATQIILLAMFLVNGLAFVLVPDRVHSGFQFTLAFIAVMLVWMFRPAWKYAVVAVLFFLSLSSVLFFPDSRLAYLAEGPGSKPQISLRQMGPQKVTTEYADFSKLHNVLAGEEQWQTRAYTIAAIQWKYLQLLVYPHPLVHQYGIDQFQLKREVDVIVIASVLLHLALMMAAVYAVFSWQVWSFACLFYLCTVSIYTNIFQPMPDTLAERFLLLPSIGFCVGVAFLLLFLAKRLAGNKWAMTAFLFVAVLSVPLAFKTIQRNADWKDSFTLANNTHPYAIRNASLNFQYANEWRNRYEAGGVDQNDVVKDSIITCYQRAISIYPSFYMAHYQLGTYLLSFNEVETAKTHLEKCVLLKPQQPGPQKSLGYIAYSLKQYPQAHEYFTEELRLNQRLKQEEEINLFLFDARCLHKTNATDSALLLLRTAAQKFITINSFQMLAGNMLLERERFAEALAQFEAAVQINGNDVQALYKVVSLAQQLKNRELFDRYYPIYQAKSAAVH